MIPNDRPPRREPALAIALALLAAASLWSLASAARYRHLESDLLQDYLSAQSLREGESLYSTRSANSVLTAKDAEKTGEIVNDHPPPYILALSPLGLVPYPAAFLTLAVAGVAALIAGCLVVASELGWSMRTGTLLAAAMVIHPGSTTCLSVGNVSLILLLLIALGWSAFRRNRSGRAGAWLGLATAIKLFPGLLIVGLAAGRAWRGVAVATGVFIVVWAVAAVAVGPGDVATYIRDRAPQNARAYVSHGFNLSVSGVAHRLFGLPNPASPWLDRAAIRPELANALAWAVRVFIAIVVAIGVLKARRLDNPADRLFAILIPGMLLLSPLTWLHAVPMMVIPVAILARLETGWRFKVLFACAVAMCLNDRWLANQWVNATGRNVEWPVNLILLAPTWGMLGTLLLAAFPRRSLTA